MSKYLMAANVCLQISDLDSFNDLVTDANDTAFEAMAMVGEKNVTKLLEDIGIIFCGDENEVFQSGKGDMLYGVMSKDDGEDEEEEEKKKEEEEEEYTYDNETSKEPSQNSLMPKKANICLVSL
jgi:hypothetical protein